MPRRPNARPMRSRPDTMRNLTLQRRHYQFIADVIKTYQANPNRRTIAAAFAYALRGTNGGYNPDRFLEACGPEPEPPILCLLCQSCHCHQTP